MKRDWGKAPNLVSSARLLLVAVPVLLIFSAAENPSLRWWALLAFAAIAATDALDGYLARRLNQITEWGKFLDPIVDKVLVAATFVALIWLYGVTHAPEFWMLVSAVAVMFAREIILSWQIWRRGTELQSATLSGKLKMVSQCVMLVVWLMPLGEAGIYARIATLIFALALTLYSWFSYYEQFVRSTELPRYERS